MENQEPEVIQCVEWLERLATRASIGKISKRFALIESSLNLRRLHARNQELEAMLDAVGAGGVSAQRVTHAKDHVAQPRKMVAAQVVLPEPVAVQVRHIKEKRWRTTVLDLYDVFAGGEYERRYIYTEQQVRDLLDKATCTKSQTTAQEPFGYFKAEPFGWRDCAETDEGAIALYEAPQPQADARDAELVAAVVYASTEAMNSSMESPSFDGSIILESHHAASLSLALDELEQHRAAIAAAKGE